MNDLTWQAVIVYAVVAACITIVFCVVAWRMTNDRQK